MKKKWLEESRKLREKIATDQDPAYKKALELELKRHEEEYLLKDLSSRAFLPGYGFPTNVVNLNTYNVEDFKQQRRRELNPSREDNIFTAKEQPSRGLDIAIREYAPGAQVVIDGRVYRSAGINLGFGPQKFDVAWRCKKCGSAGVAENAYSNSNDLKCSHCNADIAFSEYKKVLRPAGFTTDFYESTSNDISSQKFIRVERPRIQLIGESLNLPDSRCGFIKYGHEGSVFYHSSGEHEKGYAVCMSCGRADSMTPEGTIPNSLAVARPHRPLSGRTSNGQERECSGHVMDSVHLGYQIQTDVLELFPKNPVTGQWLSDSDDDQVIATTIAVALRDAIAEELGIASTEMGFGARLDKDIETGQNRSVVQVFDLVSGGAGFVIAGVSNIADLLHKTLSKLNCRANCENVCSQCLASQDSRVEQEELDRISAREWLLNSQFESYLALPDEFKHIQGATYCSQGSLQFIRSSMNQLAGDLSSRTVQIILRGDTADWDLAYPSFREKILTWKVVDKFAVRLCIEKSASLNDDCKRDLRLLNRLGIEVVTLSNSSSNTDCMLVAQIYSDDRTLSLYSNQATLCTPGESWLHSEQACTLVSSKLISPIAGQAIDTSAWEKVTPTGSKVLEITEAFNGPVLSLCSKLKKMIEDEVPELASLIEHDQAVSISYSDRYLKSPLVIDAAKRVSFLFRNDNLRTVNIQTLETANSNNSYLIKHDWKYKEDQEIILSQWLKNVLGCSLNVCIKEKAWELLHGRVITIDWLSGKQSKILLDQGMGYWNPRMPYRDEMEFNFELEPEEQLVVMTEKFKIANMVNSGNWPTYITFTPIFSVQ